MNARAVNWATTRFWTDEDYLAYWKERTTTNECGCWLSTRPQSQSKGRPIGSPGYVQVNYRGKRYQLHRLVYTLLVGPIPDGHVVAHRCDNPPCFNPEHLFACTEKENMQDAGQKKRWPRQYRETCINGHPRTPENAVRHGAEQKLQCRVCIQERGKRRWREQTERMRERLRELRKRKKERAELNRT